MFFKKDLKTEDKYLSSRYVFLRLLKENIFPYYFLIALSIGLMLLVSSTTAYQAFLVQPALDSTLFNVTDKNMLYSIPILVAVVAIVKGILSYYQGLVLSWLNIKVTNDLRLKMFTKFIHADIATYNNKSTGMMISNMTNDLMATVNTINLILSGTFRNFFTTLGLVGVMFYMNYKLSLMALFGLPLIIYPMYFTLKRIKKLMTTNQQNLGDYIAKIDDTFKSARIVKAYSAEQYEISKFKELLKMFAQLGYKISRYLGVPGIFIESVTGIGVAAVLYYGGNQVLSGEATPGEFFSFFTSLMMAYKPMKSMSSMNMSVQLGLVAAGRVFNILDEEPIIKDKDNAIELKNIKGHIEFKNINFSYITERSALNGINLKIKAGQTVALVGHSGGGKSTIMSLILRFYDPNSGEILVDGHNIKDIKISSLRDAISYVGQDVQLFDDSFYENIRYSRRDATEAEVIKAAEMAQAHEFIEQAVNGYQTKIGQNGIMLSGGQKQRISIARALLKNTPILLLDEATSALDPISEKYIQKGLENLMKNRTSLVIAHRLSTIIHSDKICVVSAGKIVEQGTHKELIDKAGLYSSLYAVNFEN